MHENDDPKFEILDSQALKARFRKVVDENVTDASDKEVLFDLIESEEFSAVISILRDLGAMP